MDALNNLESKKRTIENKSYLGWGVVPAVLLFVFVFINAAMNYSSTQYKMSRGPLGPLWDGCVFPIIIAVVAFYSTGIGIKFLRLSIVNGEITREKAKIEEKGKLINLAKDANSKLSDLQKQIQALTNQLEISFPVSYLTHHAQEIQHLIDIHGRNLLRDSTPLDKLIKALTRTAEEDKIQLEKANNLYQTTLNFYTNVSRKVNRIGSMPLIKELEYNYAGLTHNDLKSLLTQGRWSEYNDIVNEILSDLQRLENLAINYESYEEEYEESPNEETDEEKAYRILRISPNASNEQIKKLYKKLASAYHPDSQITDDDDEFKEINRAYETLKRIRKIS